jgi:5-methyltetrahydrofolate--homocysteine methyltransferase
MTAFPPVDGTEIERALRQRASEKILVLDLLIVAVILEALTPEILFRVFEPLDHRAHRPVEDEDLFRRALTQGAPSRPPLRSGTSG